MKFPRQYDLASERDALVLAGFLSTLLHLALMKWLLMIWQAPATSTPLSEIETTVASDIESDKASATKSGAPSPAAKSAPENQARAPPADAPTPNEQSAPRGEAWAQSRAIFSSQELADPRNRRAVESLKHLEPQTRSQQLCDLEAILQINRQFDGYAVDFVIAYATEAVRRKSDAVIAHGAAFHSNGRWYNLAFECQLTASQRGVAQLKFKLGDAIDEGRWADLNLPKAPANPLGGE
jgi:hypothetical protein